MVLCCYDVLCRLVQQEQEKLLEVQRMLAERDATIHQQSSQAQQLQAQVRRVLMSGSAQRAQSSFISFSVLCPYLCVPVGTGGFLSADL